MRYNVETCLLTFNGSTHIQTRLVGMTVLLLLRRPYSSWMVIFRPELSLQTLVDMSAQFYLRLGHYSRLICLLRNRIPVLRLKLFPPRLIFLERSVLSVFKRFQTCLLCFEAVNMLLVVGCLQFCTSMLVNSAETHFIIYRFMSWLVVWLNGTRFYSGPWGHWFDSGSWSKISYQFTMGFLQKRTHIYNWNLRFMLCLTLLPSGRRSNSDPWGWQFNSCRRPKFLLYL